MDSLSIHSAINPNDVLRELGITVPTETQEVRQQVGNNEMVNPVEDAEIVSIDDEAYNEASQQGIIPQPELDAQALLNAVEMFEEEVANKPLPESQKEEPKTTLPKLAESILSSDAVSRFKGASWFDRVASTDICLAGVGGIGSWVALLLGRMHPKTLTIYDADVIEMANLSGQFYSRNDVNRLKVSAVADAIAIYCNYFSISTRDDKFTKDSPASDIMICGFDNMAARKTFFESWKKHVLKSKHPEECLFIDGRLNAEEFQVFAITGNNQYHMDKYEREYLFSDTMVAEATCSYKQTSYCANMIASVMVNVFTNFMHNSLGPIIPRDVPFKTWYDASMMFFKTDNS